MLNAAELLVGVTPGPWAVTGDGRYIWTADGSDYVCDIKLAEDDPEVIANARLIASAPRLARRVIELEDENGALREIISRCASSLNSGAFISPEATVDFMWHLPKEIELRIAALKGEGDA